MKISVCITVFNEEGSVEALLDSLIIQTFLPDEIVIVDGGSTDNTLSVISNYKFPASNKKTRLKVINKKCTRAQGRNIAVRGAKHGIIAMTDADCTASAKWLERITKPFADTSVDIVAGFYDMRAESPMQKAASVFLGVVPQDFDEKTFLPSTRSIAFRRSAWKKVGGFPEKDDNSAEDTDFNYLAVKKGLKFARVKNARVGWRTPDNLGEIFKKFYTYAYWDAKYGAFYHPVQDLASHNIKMIFKVARYAIMLGFAIAGMFLDIRFIVILLLLIVIYSLYSFFKVFGKTQDVRAGLWGVVMQFVSDIAGMSGFFRGYAGR